jgi:hypothetical protein
LTTWPLSGGLSLPPSFYKDSCFSHHFNLNLNYLAVSFQGYFIAWGEYSTNKLHEKKKTLLEIENICTTDSYKDGFLAKMLQQCHWHREIRFCQILNHIFVEFEAIYCILYYTSLLIRSLVECVNLWRNKKNNDYKTRASVPWNITGHCQTFLKLYSKTMLSKAHKK